MPLSAGAASGLALGDLGQPFSLPKGIPVEWKAATNALPPKVAIYKTIPHPFSPAVVGSVMALGGWTMQQRTNVPGRARVAGDKDLLHFENADGIGYLSIYPPSGIITYLNEKARTSGTGYPKGVPDEEETLRLGREFLKKLEISERDLVKKANGALHVYRGRQTQGRHGVEEVISRDVYFIRQVDGIPFNGIGSYGGVELSLGDNGKVAELRVVWPGLKPMELLPVATAKEIMDSLKNGRAVIAAGETTDVILGTMKELTKITVNKVIPVYSGSSMHEPKEIIHPFASLEITAHFAKTNYTAVLNCPLVIGK